MPPERLGPSQPEHQPEPELSPGDLNTIASMLDKWLFLLSYQEYKRVMAGNAAPDQTEIAPVEEEVVDSWLTHEEAAEFLDISDNRLYEIMKENRVRWQPKPRSQRLVSLQSLVEYARSRRRSS